MRHVALAALAVLLGACSADATRNSGARCVGDGDCTSNHCYRGFCIDEISPSDAAVDALAPDGALDSGDDAAIGDDATMGDDAMAGDDAGDDATAGDDAGQDAGPATCPSGCPPSFPTCCDGACVDLMTDNVDCGRCGNPCIGSVCSMGLCCTPPMVACAGACVTLGDNTNCASCGDACMGASACCHHSGGGTSCVVGLCL